jgi:hypothetical protein
MKFFQPMTCDGGGSFPFETYGTQRWSSVVCDRCGKAGGQIDPLSVSVIAERLLYRSRRELESGEFTLSIVIGTMAVESFLTRLFFKVRGMDCYSANFRWPTEDEENGWETEYKKTRGGFAGPADVVSEMTVGMSFDDFVRTNAQTSAIIANFPKAGSMSPKQFFQRELFHIRNRIAHWGFVDTTRELAEDCHHLSIAIVAILREIDKARYGRA